MNIFIYCMAIDRCDSDMVTRGAFMHGGDRCNVNGEVENTMLCCLEAWHCSRCCTGLTTRGMFFHAWRLRGSDSGSMECGDSKP